MARITEKDWKKLTSKIKYKGVAQRPAPKWSIGRKGRKIASAWDRKLETRLYKKDRANPAPGNL